MKKLITLFLIATAISFASQAQLLIPYMAAPTIDGTIDGDDWGDTWIDIALERPGLSTHDMSSKFHIGHDDDNIYLIIQTQDSTPNNDATALPNTYERDCNEIFFSLHSVTDVNAYVAGDWQIRHQRAGEVLVDGSGTTAAEFEAGNFEAAVADDGVNMYTIEYRFSIATLAGDSDFDSENLRMDIQTADNTTGESGGRTQQMFWGNDSDLQWNNVNIFSPAVLEGNQVPKYPVTFTITDQNLVPIDSATVQITGRTPILSDSVGKAIFPYVLPADSITYSITKTGFKVSTGTISVVNSGVDVNIILTVMPFPVTFNITDENSLPIEGATIELTGYETQITDSTGAVIFSEVLPAEDIAYSVTKTGFNGTEGTITVVDAAIYKNVVISLISSISDNTRGDFTNLLIYPNPASKEFSISSTQNVESLVILNLHGQVVYKFKGKLMKNEKYQIDVSELLSGIYLIKADSKIVRLIVE